MYRSKKKSSRETSSLKSQLIVYSILAASLVTFILIFFPGFYNFLHEKDIQALKAINSNRIKSLDLFFLFLTNTSSTVCILITVITLFISQFKKSVVLRLKGLQLLLTFLTSFIVIKSLKFLIGRQRPYITYDFLDKLALAESLSFPSGHTFEAFAFATAFALVYKHTQARVVIIIWAILVGCSRMILGMHYVTDVVGGIIFGVFTGYAVHKLYRRNISVSSSEHT